MFELYIKLVQEMNRAINEISVCCLDRESYGLIVTVDKLFLYAMEADELGEVQTADRYYVEVICFY